MDDVIKKFSSHLKNVLTRALVLAVEQQQETIEPVHLFWAVGTQIGSVGADILEKTGITQEDFKTIISRKNAQLFAESGVPVLSENSKMIIEKAVLTANLFEHAFVGTEHLLSAFVHTDIFSLENIFEHKQIDITIIQKHINAVFKTTSAFPNISDWKSAKSSLLSEFDPIALDDTEDEFGDTQDVKISAIDYFTHEITEPKLALTFDPLIGRDHELTRMMQILCRRHKNNPILVGDPGVGKTAVVEGLARHIVEKNVPALLRNKRIYRLDLAALLAGTMYRGEFESRLRQLVEEITERPEIILFIDEVHTIAGAGASSGSLDASNLLKPALARGQIRCIGATTPDEYKKFIETDGALERRFQRVRIEEPTKEETRSIILGVKSQYETFHGVTYLPEAIESTLELSARYLTDQKFPDKALDLLDEAGAAANMTRKKIRPSKEHLEHELSKIREEKQQAVEDEEFEKAGELKETEKNLEKELSETKSHITTIIDVTSSDIHKMVSEITGIPLQALSSSIQTRLLGLEKRLTKKIIGQPDTITRVSNAILRAKLHLQPEHKPLASFLFTGPTGVGKTALAQAISNEVFDQSQSFLRLDMSEYSAAFTVSKLIGAPAGYVGYRENAKLTDFVKQHPHSVILFDEIEKAHPDVHNLLLQILDNGMLSDATGRQVNFRNAIIILTSNEGSEHFNNKHLGFRSEVSQKKETDENVRKTLIERFKRELVNRIGHVCIFSPLTEPVIEKITVLQLTQMQKRLAAHDISFNVDRTVARTIAKSVDKKFGARDVERMIETHIEHPLATLLLSKTTQHHKTFKAQTQKNGIIRLTPTKK